MQCRASSFATTSGFLSGFAKALTEFTWASSDALMVSPCLATVSLNSRMRTVQALRMSFLCFVLELCLSAR